ncbi:MAG: (2Fe-2S) ferredoxin domain-containing protein [Candidatus Hydrogenedentes bacterium]|nr:(2Fe-2S) ferredoxin domain-containing protein [Candidatus Hydrogenedentota bacterium]
MQQRPMPFKKILFVCTNERIDSDRACCAHRGGGRLRDLLKEMVKARGLKNAVRVSASGCQDRCEQGPNIMLFPDNIWYSGVEEKDLEVILDAVVQSLGQGDVTV